MQLLTKELEQRFSEIGSQEHNPDPIVIAKYFNPSGPGTWYATEYDPTTRLFFGYVSIFGDYNDEWGAFSLDELESVVSNLGLHIERDLFCGEFPISTILPKIGSE